MKKILALLFMTGSILSMYAQTGTLCLTFDDRNFAGWEKAIPIFRKYDAHATFFISGRIDKQALATMKKLQSAGHSVGLHGLNHLRACDYLKQHGSMSYLKDEIMPQLEVCRRNGIIIRAFAYPNSQNSSETDKELFTVFDFLRTNSANVKKNDVPLAQADGCFVKKTAPKQLFYGFPAGGRFNMAEIKTAMKRAAEEKSILVFYAHNIMEEIPKTHHIAFSQLVELLEYARGINLSIKGLNEF